MTKDKRLIVRCSSMDELEQWHAKAKAAGYRSTSAYVRAFMAQACEKSLPGPVPYGGRLKLEELKDFSSRIRDVGKQLNETVKLAHFGRVHSLEGVEREAMAVVDGLMEVVKQRNEEPVDR